MFLVDSQLEPEESHPWRRWQKGEVPPTPPVPDWGWDQGKAGTCATDIKTVQGAVLDQRGLSVKPGERRDWWGGRPTQSMQRFGKLIGSFGRAHGPFHTQTNTVQGEQINTLSCSSLLLVTWTCMVCLPVLSIGHLSLAATWPWPPEESLSHSLAHVVTILAGTFV